MRVTVFGGTGPTGLLLINQALAEDPEVTAYTRSPSKLPTHERLTAVQGQLDDAAAITEAVRGSDAVLRHARPDHQKRPTPRRWSPATATSSRPCTNTASSG